MHISFLREHLISHHYAWTGSVHAPGKEEPGRRLFNRLDGNQVLNMINFFGQSIGKLTLQDGRRLEELINKQLPDTVKSELSVFNWLRGVYLYYWH
jgi:hypothetical protein